MEKEKKAPTQPQAEAPQQKKKVAVKRKPPKSKARVVTSKSKRKEAIARAYIKAGNGSLRINGVDLNAITNVGFKRIVTEPLALFDSAKQMANKLDIRVNVRGGGTSAQAHATRGAIAKGLVAYSEGSELKSAYLAYDRSLLIDDPRRVEPKKYKGPKARARFQKSYR